MGRAEMGVEILSRGPAEAAGSGCTDLDDWGSFFPAGAFQGYWGPVLRTHGLVLCPSSSFFPFVSQVWAEASAGGREVGLGAGESGKREIGDPIPTFKFHMNTRRP